jgi:hypothetical protein
MLPEPSFPAKPADFVGRTREIESFKTALRQSLVTMRMPSFAVLGNWGIGKSSLLFKLADCCSQLAPRVLPVHLSVSQDIADYLRFAESLCDNLADALAASDSLTSRLRTEARNWKFKQVKAGPFIVERNTSRRFLTSGSALLRHTLAEAWHHFIRPARLAGAVFFLDDLQNLSLTSGDTALTIRDQFQALAVDGMNFSVCISAKADYFSGIHSFAEPAVRFYSKIILAPFTFDETSEYTQAVFDSQANIGPLARWLYDKTLGHPYFLAFISRELLARGNGSPAQFWREISAQLEREKFESDLAQLSEKDIGLLRALASYEEQEFSPTPFVKEFQYEYFRRLTERGLLIRSGRGRYKLYHSLFRAFLQQRT